MAQTAKKLPNPMPQRRGKVVKKTNAKVPNPKPSGMPMKSVPAKTTAQKVVNPKPNKTLKGTGVAKGK